MVGTPPSPSPPSTPQVVIGCPYLPFFDAGWHRSLARENWLVKPVNDFQTFSACSSELGLLYSIFSRFFISFILIFLLKKHRVKLPFPKIQICFTMLSVHLFCQRYLLFLAGDIHPNPGPLHGKLKFGHWNLNSILTRNKSKISLIEALQAT